MLGKLSSLCRKKNQESSRSRDISTEITNLDSLLHDIYLRYISLDDADFRRYYRVVQVVFLQMHRAMKRSDRYYRKYSSRVQYAGSHSDHLRISKPDEFDIDIVIGLPLNIKQNPDDPAESDFIIEPLDPGFVQLKMGVQYQRLPWRDRSEWQNNSAAYRWGDSKHYLQRSEFINWFKGVVDKALSKFMYEDCPLPVFEVDGEEYTVRKSESGPAITLHIEGEDDFKCDVDLVPALRFPVDRWPISSEYRPIPSWWQRNQPRRPYKPHSNSQHHSNTSQRSAAPWHNEHTSSDCFMLVSKPNPRRHNPHVRNRTWRIAMQDQERMLMHNTNNMRQAIRFMKKFRDAREMNHIKSYYIKTMFFWEAMEHYEDRDFWNNSPAFLFTYMLQIFLEYLTTGWLPHFWHRKDNLFEGIQRSILRGYARTVKKLLRVLEQPAEYMRVAEFLLTPEELQEYYNDLDEF